MASFNGTYTPATTLETIGGDASTCSMSGCIFSVDSCAWKAIMLRKGTVLSPHVAAPAHPFCHAAGCHCALSRLSSDWALAQQSRQESDSC